VKRKLQSNNSQVIGVTTTQTDDISEEATDWLSTCVDAYACRPIHDAVEADSIATVRLLLCAGADVTMKKYSGDTLLHLAKSAEMKCFIKGLLTVLAAC